MVFTPHQNRLSRIRKLSEPALATGLATRLTGKPRAHRIVRGGYSLTRAATLPLHISSLRWVPLPTQLADQSGQLHQVSGAEQGAVPASEDLRVRSHQIGPLQRDGTNRAVIHLQEQMRPVAVVSLANTGQLLAAQRMEGMQDAHKPRPFDGTVRIPT